MDETKYRLIGITKDWKDQWTAEELNRALNAVGKNAEFVLVGSTGSDTDLMLCTSPKMSEEQAQDLFEVGDFMMCDQVYEGTFDAIRGELEEKNGVWQCLDPNCPDAKSNPYHSHPGPQRTGE